ncbi:hypothetical protein [Staphylococcus americanisciuri]|uniref:Uncharacterized protein n=1 Tax=Staphylococcus americanisciuri TaxID=2973940 RepID=A0ABT2F2H8_9STAP|nr:hypothetical protein [Staphylococcus americanisciuri]MCS4486648.1 hypothetical protein [Staphylococcus americanisciuri]
MTLQKLAAGATLSTPTQSIIKNENAPLLKACVKFNLSTLESRTKRLNISWHNL